MEDKTFVINIGRQLGSGGKEIGLRLAEMFGITCYDNELIKRRCRKFRKFRREKARNPFVFLEFHSLCGKRRHLRQSYQRGNTIPHSKRDYKENCRRTFVHIHRTLCRLCASRQETLRQCFCFRRLFRPRKAALSAPRHNRASRRETYSPGRPTTFAILQLLFRRHLGFCRHLSPLHKFQRFRH